MKRPSYWDCSPWPVVSAACALIAALIVYWST